MDEAALIEKLRRIEALHAGATTPGERVAAAEARERVLARLREREQTDPPVEHKFTIPDAWSRHVFNALLRRYGLRPYRYRRQHQQTVMVRVSRRFSDETLWPEFVALSDELRGYLQSVTNRVVLTVLGQSGGEAEEVANPAVLGAGGSGEDEPT